MSMNYNPQGFITISVTRTSESGSLPKEENRKVKKWPMEVERNKKYTC